MLSERVGQEKRCDCGKLLFKRTPRGLEFKCNRCKRIHFVPLDHLDKEFKNLCPLINQEDSENREA